MGIVNSLVKAARQAVKTPFKESFLNPAKNMVNPKPTSVWTEAAQKEVAKLNNPLGYCTTKVKTLKNGATERIYTDPLSGKVVAKVRQKGNIHQEWRYGIEDGMNVTRYTRTNGNGLPYEHIKKECGGIKATRTTYQQEIELDTGEKKILEKRTRYYSNSCNEPEIKEFYTKIKNFAGGKDRWYQEIRQKHGWDRGWSHILSSSEGIGMKQSNNYTYDNSFKKSLFEMAKYV